MFENIIKEEVNALIEQRAIFTISEMYHHFKRMGFDDISSKVLRKLMARAYKNKGDNGVIELFKEITGLTIYPISRGRYTFSPTTK